jgi:hypothetical protein
MNAGQSQPVETVWFLPAFIGVLLLMTWFFSRLSGWHELAKTFRSPRRTAGRSYWFRNVGFGSGYFTVRHGGILVRLDSEGIYLSAVPLPFHPRLFIPWRAVVDCKRERSWLLTCTAIYVADCVYDLPIRLLFHGRLGRDLLEAWRQYTASTSSQKSPAS